MKKIIILSFIVLAFALTACNKDKQAAAPVQAPAVVEQSAAPMAEESAPAAEEAAAPMVEQATAPSEEAEKKD